MCVTLPLGTQCVFEEKAYTFPQHCLNRLPEPQEQKALQRISPPSPVDSCVTVAPAAALLLPRLFSLAELLAFITFSVGSSPGSYSKQTRLNTIARSSLLQKKETFNDKINKIAGIAAFFPTIQ